MRIGIAIGLLALVSQSASSQAYKSEGTLGDIVVTGEQPGPGLWKLTRDDHVLWILATVTQKPRDITWHSQQVADVLDETQAVIDQQLQGSIWPVNVELDVKSFNPLAGMRAAMGAQKLKKALPPTPPLRESLPPDVYERYAKLKAVYLPHDASIETLRPRNAANRLYNAAIAARGLTTRAMIHEEVHKLARSRKVKVNEITKEYEFDLETMIAVSMEFAQIPVAAELPCFLETLDDLEHNLPVITERANTWAIGNVDKLRKLPLMLRESCDKGYWSAPRWANLHAELEAFWLEQVEASVVKNKSTLVMLDAAELFRPTGLLETLRGRGFDVEEP